MKRELERKVQRLDALVRELEALPDEGARQSAIEAFRALLELHGDGLARLVEVAGPEVTARLADDAEVGGLLLLYGLHPVPFDQRVQRALDGVRPYLGTHGGGVQVLDASDGVVSLRLEGTCNGCPSSQVTLQHAIERAILDGAPDVVEIRVDGVVEPAPAGFVPLASIGREPLACPTELRS